MHDGVSATAAIKVRMASLSNAQPSARAFCFSMRVLSASARSRHREFWRRTTSQLPGEVPTNSCRYKTVSSSSLHNIKDTSMRATMLRQTSRANCSDLISERKVEQSISTLRKNHYTNPVHILEIKYHVIQQCHQPQFAHVCSLHA